MGGISRNSSARGTGRLLLVLLCAVIVLVCGTVQVAHTHPDGAVSHADCSLCATAHVAIQVTDTPTAAPPVAVTAAVEALPLAAAPSVLSTFALFTRPPPVALTSVPV